MSRQELRFEFSEKKATEAAAILLREAKGRMNYMKLIKMLYMADREALRQFGEPITGDDCFSMRHGPVLSITLNLVKEEIENESFWARHITREGYDVRLTDDPGDDDLSPAEVDLLRGVHDRYRDIDQWELRRLTHELPEWEDPGDSCRKIPMERILAAVGKSEEEIEAIAEEVEANRRFDAVFHG